MKTIQIVNHLNGNDDEVEKIAEVAQHYANLVCGEHDLAPALVTFVKGAAAAEGSASELGIFENPDVADALGYHDLDKRGVPYGKAFLSMVPNGVLLYDRGGHGASLAGVVMHELGELLGDWLANSWVSCVIHDPSSKRTYGMVALELADPVQDNAFQLPAKDGTAVDCSDFVKQNWFNPDTLETTPTSYTGAAKGPFTVAHGGYAIVAQQQGTTQIFGRKLGAHHDRILDIDAAPPAWREAIRALPISRSNRRRRVAA